MRRLSLDRALRRCLSGTLPAYHVPRDRRDPVATLITVLRVWEPSKLPLLRVSLPPKSCGRPFKVVQVMNCIVRGVVSTIAQRSGPVGYEMMVNRTRKHLWNSRKWDLGPVGDAVKIPDPTGDMLKNRPYLRFRAIIVHNLEVLALLTRVLALSRPLATM